MALQLAKSCLNIGQKEAQCTGACAARFCPEYTLWAELQASGTCSAVGQIKAVFTSVTRALLAAQAPAIYLPSFLPASVSDSQPRRSGLMTPHRAATCNGTKKTKKHTHTPLNFKRQKTAQMRLLWVAVFHDGS